MPHNAKEKYIFVSFVDSSIGVYENVGQYSKRPFFIDKVNFFNPVSRILNTFSRDQLIISCKEKCVAFSNPQTLKQRFILQVEQSELNGLLWDPEKRILWTFGNDKRLRGWSVPATLFGTEGECRVLREWDKELIFDVMDPQSLTKYGSKGHFPESKEREKINGEVSGTNDLEENPSKRRNPDTPTRPIVGGKVFKEDAKPLIPEQTGEDNPLGGESDDEDSAAKKYGLVRNTRIGNLAVSNSENDSQEEKNPLGQSTKPKPKVNMSEGPSIKKEIPKKVEVDSETESDDDLTGWF